jgi:hypothetical protein
MNISDEMYAAGRKIAEENFVQFWVSSRDDDAWRWFLSTVYEAMRELEPEPKKGK